MLIWIDGQVVPHGSSVFSYHVVTAFQNCPMSEFVTPELDKIVGYFDGLFEGEPLPKVRTSQLR